MVKLKDDNRGGSPPAPELLVVTVIGGSVLQLSPNPSIHDLQSYVIVLEKHRGFEEDTVLQKCLILAEEVGELCKSIRKKEAGICVDETSNIGEPGLEIADILTVLLTIANRLDVDLEEAFRRKEVVNQNRTWA